MKPAGCGPFAARAAIGASHGDRLGAAALALLALLAALLAGCASPASLPAGLTEAEVVARHGRPDAVHALPDGGRRLEYTLGPFQQHTWMVDFDAAGRGSGARQVRTLANLMRLRSGVDTVADVRREFGTPWKVERYHLTGLTALMYPHQEGGWFASMAAVHVDEQGVVRFVQNGPDPRFMGGGDRRD